MLARPPLFHSVLLMLIVVLGFAHFRQSQQLTAALDALEQGLSLNEKQLLADSQRFAKELMLLRQDLQELSNSVQQPGSANSASSNGPAGITMANSPVPDRPAAVREKPNMTQSFRLRFEDPAFRRSMAENSVETNFGPFIDALDLDPFEKNQLRQLMTEQMEESFYQNSRENRGEITKEELAALSRQSYDKLQNDIAAILDDEQMAAYRQWQEDAPIRTRSRMEAQQYVFLSSSLPTLSDSSRAEIAAVLADLMMTPRENPDQPNDEYMRELHSRTLENLEDTLEPQDLDKLREHFERQRQTTIMF